MELRTARRAGGCSLLVKSFVFSNRQTRLSPLFTLVSPAARVYSIATNSPILSMCKNNPLPNPQPHRKH